MQASTQPAIPIIIVAAAITATATLAAAIITWLKDRNGRARRIQVLDEATKYLAFWELVRSSEKSGDDDAFKRRIALAKELVETRGAYSPGRYGLFVY